MFTIGLVLNLSVLGFAGAIEASDFAAAARLIPTAVVGFAASSYVKHHFDGRLLRNSTLVLAAGAALTLLIRSLG